MRVLKQCLTGGPQGVSSLSRVSRVVRGGIWLYGSSIINNLMGFLYWMVISAIAGSEVLGTTSAVVGFSSLVAGVLSLGAAVGLQRYLGVCLGKDDVGCLRRYFWSTALFAVLSYALAGTALALVGFSGIRLGSVTPTMLEVAGLMTSLGFVGALNALLISYLRTDLLFMGALAGNSLKLAVGIGLVRLGLGWVGASVGYLCVNLAMLAIGLLYTRRIVGLKATFSVRALTDVIRAGVASWLPNIVVLAGQWLGVLAVYTSSTAAETGHYYVAFTIANFVLTIGSSMLMLLLPVLSSMPDGRKRAAGRVLKISLTVMTPVAAFIATYPWLPLSLLGKEYVAASQVLTLLLTAAVPTAMTICVTSLMYAYGSYEQVLAIGLAQNVPRIILYYLLTPVHGGLGTALAYVAGAFTGLVCSLRVAYAVNFDVGLRRVSIIVVVPAALSITSYGLSLPWLAGLFLTAVSYLVYVRAGILTRSDIREVAVALLSEGTVNKLYERFKPVIDALIP